MTLYLFLSALAGAGGMAAAVRWLPSVREKVAPTGGGGPRPVPRK